MKHILVVDDNEGDQFLHELAILNSVPDAHIHMAHDGVEALAFLERTPHRLDIILLDINMPRMNGHAFLKKYAELTNSEIPIVVTLTSSDQSRDRDEVFQYKAVKDYLLKPLDSEKVKKIIEDLEMASQV